jgi:hypothetical protein
MEIVYYNLKGNAGDVQETMPIYHNATSTTNYSVFPSIYYNYSGSGGTYDQFQTSSAIQNIVIGTRASNSFIFALNKATGDNVNCYLVFLVVYNAPISNYPTSY